MGTALSAAWAILLGLLSFIEANVIENWGIGLHFFHLPFFSDGSPLRRFCWSYYHNAACVRSDPSYVKGGLPLGQFWVYFVLLLFMLCSLPSSPMRCCAKLRCDGRSHILAQAAQAA